MNKLDYVPSALRDLGNPSGLTRANLDRMSEGVSLSREDGTIVYTNPAEDALFGYGPGELWGQHVSVQNAYPPEENERIVAGVIAELKGSGTWSGEWRNRRRDGTEFTTRSRISRRARSVDLPLVRASPYPPAAVSDAAPNRHDT